MELDCSFAKIIDFNPEGSYRVLHNGIQLLPKVTKPFANTYTFSALDHLPVNFFLMNLHSEITAFNQQTKKIALNDESVNKIFKRDVSHFSIQRSAADSLQHDQQVLKYETILIRDEEYIRKDGVFFYDLAVKMPCYDAEKRKVGIFGFCLVNYHAQYATSLLKGIEALQATGLFPFLQKNNLHAKVIDLMHQYNLTKRELECLYYLNLGYTIKIIANKMNLSPRTIESYLENIKYKLNVRYKLDLMEFVRSQGLDVLLANQ